MENESLYRWVKAIERLPIEKAGNNPLVKWEQDFGGKIDGKCAYILFSTLTFYLENSDKYFNIEWLEQTPESEQDELWKGAVEIMADDILDRRQKNIPASVPELIKKLSSTYHLIKK